MENEYYSILHKLLNRLIDKSRKFCNDYCIPDGLMNILIVYNETHSIPDDVKYNRRLSYDFDYFALPIPTP